MPMRLAQGPTSAGADIRRSARGLPPVWQVAQYCRLESAKLTSRTVSPQTGQGWPVRPCTAQVGLLLALELAGRQAGRSARPRRRATVRIASYRVCSSSLVEAAGRLERRHPARRAGSRRSRRCRCRRCCSGWRSTPLICARPAALQDLAQHVEVKSSASGSGPRRAMPWTSAGSRTTYSARLLRVPASVRSSRPAAAVRPRAQHHAGGERSTCCWAAAGSGHLVAPAHPARRREVEHEVGAGDVDVEELPVAA